MNKYNLPTSVQHPIIKLRVKIYAELIQSFKYKNQRIKSLWDNRGLPYPQPGVANGYAFSCSSKQPSVLIMERELQLEYQSESFLDYSLNGWIEQGVLLLNTSLSCDEYKPGTHTDYWRPFMIELITYLNNLKIILPQMRSLVFVSLGKQAQSFNYLINEGWHSIINRYHPAAETHGNNKFKGFFNEVNIKLQEQNEQPIKWLSNGEKES